MHVVPDPTDERLIEVRERLWTLGLRARLTIERTRRVTEAANEQVARSRWLSALARRPVRPRLLPPSTPGRVLRFQSRDTF